MIMLESWNEDDRLFRMLGLVRCQERQACCLAEVRLLENIVDWQGGACVWILMTVMFGGSEVGC
jgi:hypothetical protein